MAMTIRLRDHGIGGRRNGMSTTSAMANRSAPTSSGGSTPVARLAAALFNPHTAATPNATAYSAAVRREGRGDDSDMALSVAYSGIRRRGWRFAERNEPQSHEDHEEAQRRSGTRLRRTRRAEGA